MNSYAVVFAALIVAAAAGSVSRSTGWGSPAAPQIDLELASALAAQGSGNAAANQQLTESASGDAHNPALILSSNGVFAGAEQVGSIAQVATANLVNGQTGTVQSNDVSQDVLAVDSVIADISGANAASMANSAGTLAVGEGSLVADSASLNSVANQ